MSFSDDSAFEDEVRRIARELWPDASGDGARTISGRERDGVFVTDDVVHLIEATVSRRKDKIVQDADKTIKALSPILKLYPNKIVKGWIVTKDEPTAEQRGVCEKHKSRLQILSYNQFRSKLIDASHYLELRHHYAFGSIRNVLDDTNWQVGRDEFVEIDFMDSDASSTVAFESIRVFMRSNARKLIITGDFGAGKSMVLRELFFDLESQFRSTIIRQFPLYLNLRDHFGQNDPAEALIRHGTRIGFTQPAQLIRAWRAGYTHLILDGFDELAAAGWFSSQKKLRDVRYNAMTLVRKFISDSPAETSIILAGRSHYFDGLSEMKRSLGLSTAFRCLSLNEFNTEQVKIYLLRKGFDSDVPTWLPSRPLLLGYLVGRRIIYDLIEHGAAKAPDDGWNELLDLICQREARIEANIDSETLREILERLATKGRADPGGLGRLTGDIIFGTFQEVTGIPPDDMARMLLMRLPGLGRASEEDNSRSFIDEDLADAARAGDVIRFVRSPFTVPFVDQLCDAQTCIGQIGAAVGALIIRQSGIKAGQLGVALRRSAGEVPEGGVLAVDVYKILQELEVAYNKEPCTVRNCFIQELTISDTMKDSSAITFSDCVIQTILIEFDVNWDFSPRFRACLIGTIQGRMRREDLPSSIFDSTCEIEAFSQHLTTITEILKLDVPEGVKVLLTILKKLFVQKGRARQEAALLRGLDQRSRRLVPDVLSAVEQEKLATRITSTDNILWKPDRSQTARAFSILNLYATTTDPLVCKCANLD